MLSVPTKLNVANDSQRMVLSYVFTELLVQYQENGFFQLAFRYGRGLPFARNRDVSPLILGRVDVEEF